MVPLKPRLLFVQSSPASSDCTADDLLADLLDEPAFFDPVVSVILQCHSSDKFQTTVVKVSKIYGVNMRTRQQLYTSLERLYQHADPEKVNGRRGRFLEALMDYVGPIRKGYCFDRSHQCQVFLGSSKIGGSNHNVDVAFNLENTHAEFYECKVNCDTGFLYEPLTNKSIAKLRYLYNLHTVLTSHAYQATVAIPTLRTNVRIARQVLARNGFPGIQVIGRNAIKSLFI